MATKLLLWTIIQRAAQLIRLDCIDATSALKAISPFMPRDIYLEDTALSMQDVNKSDNSPATVQTFQSIINDLCSPQEIKQLERFAFFEQVKQPLR